MRWSTRRTLYWLANQPEDTWIEESKIKCPGIRVLSLRELCSMGLVITRWQPIPDKPADAGYTSARSLRLEQGPVAEYMLTPIGRTVAARLFEWYVLMASPARVRDAEVRNRRPVKPLPRESMPPIPPALLATPNDGQS